MNTNEATRDFTVIPSNGGRRPLVIRQGYIDRLARQKVNPLGRLLFSWMWTHSDETYKLTTTSDEQLITTAFPHDDHTAAFLEDGKRGIQDLITQGSIQRIRDPHGFQLSPIEVSKCFMTDEEMADHEFFVVEDD